MNTVDRIVKLCQERGISIAKLERECDFANGYNWTLKNPGNPVFKEAFVRSLLEIQNDQ